MKQRLSTLYKGLFKLEHHKFMVYTGLKICGISLCIFMIQAYCTWILISMNGLFFETYGFIGVDQLRDAYFDYIISTTYEIGPFVALFYFFLFFTGVYLGKVLLRPFKLINDYCEKALEDIHTPYSPDLFSDYKILTRFSEFFFSYLVNCRTQKQLLPNAIPPQYNKIHRPVFDRVFFFHFSLYIIIISTISTYITTNIASELYENISTLALGLIKNKKLGMSHFISAQSYLMESTITLSIVLSVIFYTGLAFHLYASVSAASFGFFSTMRAFMKGDFFARVHLVGFSHIRPYSRTFNKYLDHVQKLSKIDNSKTATPISLANNR
ncbi:MAG: hypothetical protein JNM93_07020 [Bacteriovoracaceae bacterium]|nr:hypothetical protein [Bacteriovoracaceae bacterium]